MVEGGPFENLGLDNILKNATGETSQEILALKEEIATHYVSDLMEKKGGGLTGMLIGKGEGLKKQLLAGDGLLSQRNDFKGDVMSNLFNAVDQKSFDIDGVTYTGTSDYIQKKRVELAAAKTVEDLTALKDKVLAGSVSTDDAAGDSDNQDAGAGSVDEESEGSKTKRGKVRTMLDKILKRDKKKAIKYNRGGKKDVDAGLDCSGLIYYTMNQSGLKVPGDSRSMFKTFEPRKLELKEDSTEVKTDVSDIKEGDIVRRNSTNPKYSWSTGAIPQIEKDGKNYRIHHVAFIKSIDKEKGIVNVVESNGSQGVTESAIDIKEQLTGTKHKSELYVAHVDYDDLAEVTPTTEAIDDSTTTA